MKGHKTMTRYEEAKAIYQAIGVDTDAAIETLKHTEIALHCWQGDDVTGFDQDGPLTGGIQVTGNYPGKARTPEELMQDYETAIKLIPGTTKLNLHACYAIFEEGEWVDRNRLEPKHFEKWVAFAKKLGVGIDFNPTFFSHAMQKADGTLSSADETVRRFWIEHGIACLKIAEYFAKETGKPTVINFWMPDGMKDIPADRYAPRARMKASLDEILATPYDKTLVFPTLESKVFGIGLESYTVVSAEFALTYAKANNITPLVDNGHYHPTELVSDKLSSLYLFSDRVALHVTRPVRWDSDHVVIFDDETREIAKEIVFRGALDRTFIALDYFDGSINRIAAWVLGARSIRKALLAALLSPVERLKALQETGNTTELLMLSEELKTLPFGDIWNEYCKVCGVPTGEAWYQEVKTYENEVLMKRG